MNVKKLIALIMTASVIFSSCQKDFETPKQDESVNGPVVSSDATANDVPETAPPVHTPVVTYVNSNVAGYWQTLPARYNLTTKRYPLIVFIHGIGELGTSITRINCCGLPRHLKDKSFPAEFIVNGVRHSFIVVSPQFKVRPTGAQVQSVIDYAKKDTGLIPRVCMLPV